jgi:hypothetical protein
MTHLALQFVADPEALLAMNGMWIFLAVGAIALFGIFLPITTWIDSRRKEREAFYKAETFRRVAETPGEAGNSAIQFLREQERIKAVKTREGLKIAGVINIGVGVGSMIFLRALFASGGHGAAGPPVYLCGLIPGFIGVAMIVYVYFMAPPVQ